MFYAASEYFDALPWSKYGHQQESDFIENCLYFSSDLETLVHKGQPTLFHLTKCFEQTLKSILDESDDVQEDIFGVSFRVDDFDEFMTVCYDEMPTCFETDDKKICQILTDWLTRSYRLYQNEEKNE